jgi:ABC-2 type transport system ATP-binding protein
LIVPITGGSPVLTQALRALDAENVAVHDVSLRRPTLDDAFLALTGRIAEPEGAAEPEGTAGPGQPGEAATDPPTSSLEGPRS